MKKILLFIICIIPLNIYGSTVVMDQDTKRVLYDSNMNEEHLIASTTKIMTAMVVINNVNIDDIVVVGEEVLKSFGSGIYIEIGEKIKVKDLLYGLLLRSGNDAAIELAYYVGGSEEGFALMMNELALSIGMNNTNFINASGLENNKGIGNTSTAYDMALLMSYANNSKIFKTITSTKYYKVTTNYKTYEWYNKNKLLNSYKYTTGGKTGYTKKAHRTLVTSATKDNKNLIVVTLDEVDDFNKHKKLYEEYFKKYKLVNIINKNNYIKENLYIDNNFDMLLKDDEIKNIKINVNKTSDINNRYGYLEVSLNDTIYYKESIYFKEKNNKNIWQRIKDFFN